jgi:hypothetical protein
MPLTSLMQTDHRRNCAALCLALSVNAALSDTAMCRHVLQLLVDTVQNMSTDSC